MIPDISRRGQPEKTLFERIAVIKKIYIYNL